MSGRGRFPEKCHHRKRSTTTQGAGRRRGDGRGEKVDERLPDARSWTGLDWIGLDLIGLDWTGLDWIGSAASSVGLVGCCCSFGVFNFGRVL